MFMARTSNSWHPTFLTLNRTCCSKTKWRTLASQVKIFFGAMEKHLFPCWTRVCASVFGASQKELWLPHRQDLGLQSAPKDHKAEFTFWQRHYFITPSALNTYALEYICTQGLLGQSSENTTERRSWPFPEQLSFLSKHSRIDGIRHAGEWVSSVVQCTNLGLICPGCQLLIWRVL